MGGILDLIPVYNRNVSDDCASQRPRSIIRTHPFKSPRSVKRDRAGIRPGSSERRQG